MSSSTVTLELFEAKITWKERGRSDRKCSGTIVIKPRTACPAFQIFCFKSVGTM